MPSLGDHLNHQLITIPLKLNLIVIYEWKLVAILPPLRPNPRIQLDGRAKSDRLIHSIPAD